MSLHLRPGINWPNLSSHFAWRSDLTSALRGRRSQNWHSLFLLLSCRHHRAFWPSWWSPADVYAVQLFIHFLPHVYLQLLLVSLARWPSLPRQTVLISIWANNRPNSWWHFSSLWSSCPNSEPGIRLCPIQGFTAYESVMLEVGSLKQIPTPEPGNMTFWRNFDPPVDHKVRRLRETGTS
jgi:hypothetical protein